MFCAVTYATKTKHICILLNLLIFKYLSERHSQNKRFRVPYNLTYLQFQRAKLHEPVVMREWVYIVSSLKCQGFFYLIF